MINEGVDVTTRMDWHADRRDWDALLTVFADEVDLDCTSLTGGDRAVVTAQFQAVHVPANPHGDPTWTLGGHYRFELVRIDAVTTTTTWATGDQQVMTPAAQRTAAR